MLTMSSSHYPTLPATILLVIISTICVSCYTLPSVPQTVRTLRAVMQGRNIKEANSIRRPMRPIEPLPANTYDYVGPILDLLKNVREVEHNLKKRTYGYGLMVVGRPIEELTIPQRMLRAALMPSKYYEEVTTGMANALNRIALNGVRGEKPSNRRTSKHSRNRPGGSGKSNLDWGDVLLRLITLAASSIPTPVVKS